METSFGAQLRQHREQRQVALSTIATLTKIKMSLLEGLERDDLTHWPAGIYRRSYIRAYAEAIGLDADSIVREFLALYPDPDEDSAVEAMARTANVLPRRRPPTRLTYLISSAISALPSLRSQPATLPSITSRDEAVGSGFSAASQDTSADAVDAMGGASSVAPDFVLSAHAPMTLEPGELMLTPPGQPLHVEQQPLLDLGLDDGRLAAMDGAGPPTADQDRAGSAAFDAVLHPEEASGHHLASDWTEAAEPQLRHEVRPARRPDEIRAVADLCVRLGRVGEARELLTVLEDATTLVDAIGLILWTWDPRARTLRPALSHGYSEELLAQVPPVPPESDNAIGSAFRSAETRIVNGDDLATGALAVPLITPSGCSGVLAAEFRDSGEQHEWVRGVVTILAAQLSMLVGHPAALRAATA